MKKTVLLVALVVSMVGGAAYAQEGTCHVGSRSKLLGFFPWERICDAVVKKTPESKQEMLGTVAELFRREEVRSRVDMSAPVLVALCEKDGQHGQYFLWFKGPTGYMLSEGRVINEIPADVASAINGADTTAEAGFSVSSETIPDGK